MCSTPFGIKDHFTQQSVDGTNDILCAQRLSASKIISPSCPVWLSLIYALCSTPFGIKDHFTLVMRNHL